MSGPANAPIDPPGQSHRSPGKDDVPGFSPEHHLRRSTAGSRHSESESGLPGQRRRIVRDLLILVFTVSVGAAIQPFADVPNPEYPEAQGIADRLNSVWRAVADDGIDPVEAAATEDLDVYFFEVNERVRTVFTHPEPTEVGHCYAVRRGPLVGTEAGILEDPNPECTPQQPGLFSVSGSWDEILPSERMTTKWYIPIMILLSAVALYAATDIPLALLTNTS